MRVERPAASRIAPTRLPSASAGSPRGCGRVTISISKPPTPMPVMSSRVTGMPASNRISTQSNPFSFGERAQPGAPSKVFPLELSDQDEIAGIDRHAEMLDAPARRLDRGRDHVAPVGDGRRAEHDHKLGAVAQHLRDGAFRSARLLVHRRVAPRQSTRRRAPGAPA